jgi:hypothetical protein
LAANGLVFSFDHAPVAHGVVLLQDLSPPFEKGKLGRVAVKLVDDWGIECLRIVEVS